MEINLIVACGADDGHIGVGSKIPWRQSADMKHFKELTTGNIIIMGRNTYEFIGKPLPNRTTIVLTKNEHYNPDSGDVYVCNTVESIGVLLKRLVSEQNRAIFVCGGKQIYDLLMPYVHVMIRTEVYAPKVIASDQNICIEKVNYMQWYMDSYGQTQPSDDKNEFDYRFVIYRRRASSKALPFPKITN